MAKVGELDVPMYNFFIIYQHRIFKLIEMCVKLSLMISSNLPQNILNIDVEFKKIFLLNLRKYYSLCLYNFKCVGFNN